MSVPTGELKDRLTTALSIRNMKPIDLAEKTGIPKSAISQYMSGYAKPKQDRVYLISKALNINEPWLLGYNVPMERNETLNNKEIDVYKLDNVYPVSTQKIPLLGEIACGEPIYADEDRESYVIAGTDIRADFCLRCKGDSMINARIMDGDIVFIRKNDHVENGEIAAVQIEDEATTDYEATLKRVYYYPDKGLLILRPENPKYKDFVFSEAEINKVHILGKAIAFQSDID